MKTSGRAGSINIDIKDGTKDVTSLYFNHPVWKAKPTDPVPDMPLDVQIELVNRCNLACASCCINSNSRAKSKLSWDVLKSIVDQAADEGVCYFTICGIGEAILHPKLFDLLKDYR